MFAHILKSLVVLGVYMDNLADRIIRLRDALGLKQADMARALGISQGKLSLIEKGSNTSIDMYDKVLDIYPHVRLEWLVRGEGDMFSTDIEAIGLPRKKNEAKKLADDWAEKLVARLELELNEAKTELKKEKELNTQLMQVLAKLSSV